MQSNGQTVENYLDALPTDRRTALTAVRKTILDNLPAGYKEIMQYGMIAYVIPLEDYPKTYNGHPLALVSLASQKNYMAIHLMCIYGSKEMNQSFIKEYKATGKKLDMGKACVRFKKLEDLPLELIGKTIASAPVDAFIQQYEMART